MKELYDGKINWRVVVLLAICLLAIVLISLMMKGCIGANTITYNIGISPKGDTTSSTDKSKPISTQTNTEIQTNSISQTNTGAITPTASITPAQSMTPTQQTTSKPPVIPAKKGAITMATPLAWYWSLLLLVILPIIITLLLKGLIWIFVKIPVIVKARLHISIANIGGIPLTILAAIISILLVKWYSHDTWTSIGLLGAQGWADAIFVYDYIFKGDILLDWKQVTPPIITITPPPANVNK
jgi:hypothetical protein